MVEYFFGITDKGKRREKNEDSFIVQELDNKAFVVACVIDGVGGYSGGEVAAAIAKAVILEHLQNLPADNIIATLQHAIVAANARIRDEKRKDSKNEQMACVLTCAVTDTQHNKFYYAHVGDTRLYLLRDHSLVKLSKDHSVVGFLEESGRLSEEEAMRHPRRNEINKALGFEENINNIKDFIETGESPFLPADIILLCSDGLSDMINSGTIMSILIKDSSIVERANELVAAANEAGGNDNITAVLVHNKNIPSPKVALKPVERKNKIKKPALQVIKPSTGEHSVKPKKSKNNLIPFLTLCCLCLLVVLLFQKNTSIRKHNISPKMNAAKINNENANAPFAHIADSGKRFTLHESLIKLSDTILISNDSFHFSGKGATILCDSNYKGPAIMVDNHARYIILDSIVFKNFDVALILQKNNVLLKNVRFINCRVPVQYQLSFPDSIINGRLKDSVFIPVSKLK